MSLIDALVRLLWANPKTGVWPERSLGEIYASASKLLGRKVNDAGIRGAIYSRPDLFERVEGDTSKWRLTNAVKAGDA